MYLGQLKVFVPSPNSVEILTNGTLVSEAMESSQVVNVISDLGKEWASCFALPAPREK